ncbi:amidohydrolase [Bacillus sp. 1P06AnD]|uniref:amidohydrolase n=1 Tax=Bacillus sp. 1P06AnD TaxID=3132208 RepID=UPI0039A0DC2C
MMKKMDVQEELYVNGRVFTADAHMPFADAFTVKDGKVTWIGNREDVQGAADSVVDFQGRTVMPGFVDAHMHPLHLAKGAKQIACTPPAVHSIEDLKKEVGKRREGQEAGGWIEGWGYDEGKLAEKRSPNRWDLDEAVADSPVVVTRTCGHIITVNSKALELAGITKETADPQGGKIDRDERGEPTGVLRESAKDLVKNCMPATTVEEDAEELAELSDVLLSYGITAITDLMALTQPHDYLDMYRQAATKGLKQRAALYYLWEEFKNNPHLSAGQKEKEQQIHVGGIKLFSDGSVSGRTAWVNPAFLGDSQNFGIQTTTKEELEEAEAAARENGVQIVVHAMGEQAIDLIVDTFHGKEPWLKDIPSVRIEHAAMPTSEAIAKAAEAGIAFVPQPVFIFAEIESYLTNLGVERTKSTYPVRSMLDAGIKVAFSSDAPATAWAEPANPFIGIQSAVTRKAYDGTDTGAGQRIDVPTALALYTREAQRVTGIPDIGQLKEGYWADFIVLDQPILDMEPESIGEIKVLETYMSGKRVFEREAVKKQ